MEKGILMKSLKIGILLFLCSISYTQTKGYLPLDIGNVWIFNNIPFIRVEVVDTISFNNKKYYKIFRQGFNPGTQYLRNEDGKVYQFITALNEEQVLYDFTVPSGTTYYLDSLEYFKKCYSNGIVQFLGKNVRQWVFSIGRNCPDCVDDDTMVDSIGWVMCSGTNYGYKLSQVTIKGNTIITDVKISDEVKPQNLSIDIYPNPFNSTSMINYSIPSDGSVHITLFNSIGQKIKTIYSGEVIKGEHSLFMDSDGLSTGVYFCHLTFSGQVLTRQVLLIK